MRYKSRTRALAGAALAATLGLAGLAFTASPAMAVEDTDVVRVAGTTRYGTAADAATSAYPAGSANVVLASGEKFPDALAGGGLAGSLDAPILLTQEGNLPADTIAALAELDAETVTILGGTDAISAAVEAELVALGYTTDRVAGLDRFETAADIAAELGGTTAVLANGLRFPDALAISPGAHALELPVLLTLADSLHEDAAAYIDANAVDTVIIVGGTAVVSQDIEDALEADGITVTRLAGDTRYESSIEIAEFHVTQGFTLDRVAMATGEDFADALAGGPYAAQMGAPMVLTQTATLTPSVATWLAENCQEIDALSILGGTAAITQDVEDAAAAAAQCALATGVTPRPELVAASIVDVNTSGELGTDGTTVAFTFDEDVATAANGTPPDGTRFNLYNSAGLADGGGIVVSQSGNTVNVLFTGITSDAAAAGLTLATTDFNAVEDPGGAESPIGDAPLGTTTGGGEQVLAAGITDGPDLVSVSGFTATSATTTQVAFTFDEAATNVVATGYNLIPIDGTAPISGTVVGGGGTTTHIVQFTSASTLSAASFARGTVDAGTVAEAADNDGNSTLDQNVLQAADVSNNGNTIDADLVSVELREDTATGGDSALFTFDENVASAVATNFVLYKDDGSTVSGAGGTAQVDPGNATRVLVTFPEGAIDRAVGAQALAGAVITVDPAAAPNEDDEVGVANVGTTPGLTSGRTAGPDLVSVSAAVETDLFGNVTGADATYTFDEAVSAPDATKFFLFAATGERFTAISCSVPTQGTATTTDDVQVVCDFEGPAGDIDRPADAVLGTVDNAAVTAVDGGVTNPEGAEFVS